MLNLYRMKIIITSRQGLGKDTQVSIDGRSLWGVHHLTLESQFDTIAESMPIGHRVDKSSGHKTVILTLKRRSIQSLFGEMLTLIQEFIKAW